MVSEPDKFDNPSHAVLFRSLGRVETKVDQAVAMLKETKESIHIIQKEHAEDKARHEVRINHLERQVSWAKGLGSIAGLLALVVGAWQGLKALLN